MALEIKIGGTTYRGTTDYSIKQQGGAVSTTSLNVLLEANPIPLVLQVAQVYLDGTLFFSGLIQAVSTPEYSSTYETKVFSIDVSSLECLMNHRLVKKNFYYYSYLYYTDIIQYLFDNYISQEGITLGSISASSKKYGSMYAVDKKKCFDVLNDIADAIGNASWWISADRKFYFKISTDFTEVVPPTHLTKLKLSEKIGDMRTVEELTGATSGIRATETNATLLATLAARTGGSGKIEIAETKDTIRNDTDAATEASDRLTYYSESEKTITCICHDLSKSEIYNSWPLNLTINGVAISGDYVVTDRTIEDHGPDAFSISVTLKNNNYFSRYGYSLKKVATIANDMASNLSDIAADNKLTASEKKDELARWNDALAAKSTLDAEADEYSVSRVAYDAAFVSLSTYLNAGAAWTSGTPAWFAGESFTETTDIVGADYDAYWQTLADTKLLLEVAIRALIQSKSDEALAAAHEASIKMMVSASSLARSRAGALLPSSIILVAKYGDDNTAYAGRFQIELSTDGSTYAVVYQSSADENSHVYTAVPTYSGAYVVLIRVRLYKAGGFTTIFEEAAVGISADTSSAPLYWGALTVAPVSNIQIDDYYFDNNVPASGGGVIRYYTGSSWAQATSAWHLWANAWKTAIADATKWATDNKATLSDVTAFMNAIIGNLVVKNGIIDYLATSTQVSTALCSDGATRRMDIDWDNAKETLRNIDRSKIIELLDGVLSSYTGVGVTRHGLRHSGASLDWVNAPEGGTEDIMGSISRDDILSKIIISSKFATMIGTDNDTVKTLPTSMGRNTSQLYNGKIYMPQYAGTTLEIYDIALGTTTIKTLPTSMGRHTSQLYNGKIYMPGDGGATLEIYNIELDTTTVKTLPTNMYRYTSQLYNGKIYMPQFAGTTLEIYDIELDTTTVKNLSTNMERYTSQLYNGKLYMPRNSGTTLEIYDIELDTTTIKTLPTNMYRYTSQLYNGKIYMPQNSGTTLEIYDIALDVTTIKTLPTNMYRYVSQLYNGKIYMPRNSGTTLEIYDIELDTTTIKTLSTTIYRLTSWLYNGKIYMPGNSHTSMEIYQFASPAPLGAGICEIGQNLNGYYFKIKTGTGTGILVCFGESPRFSAVYNTDTFYTVTFPSKFIGYPLGVFFSTTDSDNPGCYCESVNGRSSTGANLYIRATIMSIVTAIQWLAIGFYTE